MKPSSHVKRLSAVLITLNEERHLADCLKELDFVDEIVVLDGGSRDKTLEIARSFTAHVYERPFTSFSEQRNAAADKASGRWIFSIDPDERVSLELKKSILDTLASKTEAHAYQLHRRNILFGKEVRFGDARGDWKVRLYAKDRARFEGTIHETVTCEGAAGNLEGDLLHYTFGSLSEYIRRLQTYTSLEAQKETASSTNSSIYLWLRGCYRFWSIYLLRGGFLDGEVGFHYAVLSAWYEITKHCKGWEAQHAARQ